MATPASRETLRETFGRYELVGLLGEGGMGRLYIAERRGIQGFVKIVALKRILPHLANSSQLREMFLNEGRIAAKLEHPNLVATYELGEVDGQYFISMEYLPGEDLSAILARCQGSRRIPVEIAAAVAQQAAQGLHYAHEARDAQGQPIGLVHRDVNPRNVFLTYHGVVKLLDFGVVKRHDGAGTLPGAFKGKYAYCAPEQLERRHVDRRTDVFCLGIVLWECLTGARLFDSASDAMTMDAVRSRPVEPPSVLRPETPRALEEIVLRALERDPAHRFQSAHELSDALDAFLLDRDSRPTTKNLGRWLESIFSPERALLKKVISQGGAIEEALARLAALDADAGRSTGTFRSGPSSVALGARPRSVWSTSFGPGGHGYAGVDSGKPEAAALAAMPLMGAPSFRAEATTAADTPALLGARTSTRAVGIALGAVALVSTLVLVAVAGTSRGTRDSSPSGQAAKAAAKLDVQSQPPGAYIFIDGAPSGLQTPAVLGGLTGGRTVSVRLDLAGYAPVTQQVRLQSGATGSVSASLRHAMGTLRILAAGKRVAAFLDDQAFDPTKSFEAPSGSHKLRVETAGTVLISEPVDVRAGAETVIDLEGQWSHR